MTAQLHDWVGWSLIALGMVLVGIAARRGGSR